MPTSTITSKGQVTIPRAVREQLELHEGDRLEFLVEPDGILKVRPLKSSVRDLFGLLHRKGTRVVTVEEMDDAIRDHIAEDDERIRRGRP